MNQTLSFLLLIRFVFLFFTVFIKFVFIEQTIRMELPTASSMHFPERVSMWYSLRLQWLMIHSESFIFKLIKDWPGRVVSVYTFEMNILPFYDILVFWFWSSVSTLSQSFWSWVHSGQIQGVVKPCAIMFKAWLVVVSFVIIMRRSVRSMFIRTCEMREPWIIRFIKVIRKWFTWRSVVTFESTMTTILVTLRLIQWSKIFFMGLNTWLYASYFMVCIVNDIVYVFH